MANEAASSSSSPSSSNAKVNWSKKLEEAQKLTNDAAKLEFNRDYSKAFSLYVRAGELYLWLLRTYDQNAVTSETDLKARIRKAADKVLNRAQLIKAHRQEVKAPKRQILSLEEQSRAVHSGADFGAITAQAWQEEPSRSDFEHSYDGQLPLPALAPLHIQRKAKLRRRKDGSQWSRFELSNAQHRLRGRDIVQDVINDCSFVAALEVAAEHDARYRTNLAIDALFPKNDEGLPNWSANGRHKVKMRVNGIDRCIEIDDAVPYDDNGTPMCALGHKSQGNIQLWPALLEKAYLLLHGGYDFKGSNSSIDLYALSGWIPEQISLRHTPFQREKTWEWLIAAFSHGHVMLTAGTNQSVESEVNLIPSHNYAITNLIHYGDAREVELVNPWRNDWRRREHAWTQDLRDALPQEEAPAIRTAEIFVKSWDEVCSQFDSLYLNWRPSLWSHNLTFHGFWYQKAEGKSCSYAELVLDISGLEDGDKQEVVLHLERHRNAKIDTSNDWIAIHAFPMQSNSAAVNDHQRIGTYVDSHHVTTRVPVANGRYVIIAALQSAVSAEQSFTVNAYSNAEMKLLEIDSPFAFDLQLAGEWRGKSAGGNSLLSTFMHNPQYLLSIPHVAGRIAESLRITVETDRDIPVQAMLVWANEQASMRIENVNTGNVICSSGPYSYGLAIAESAQVKLGSSCVLVVSSYSAGVAGNFSVTIQSQWAQPEVTALPIEGAGMHRSILQGEWSAALGNAAGAPRFGRFLENPRYAFNINRVTIMTVRMILMETPGANRSTTQPHTNIAIIDADTADEVVSSGPYTDSLSGASIRQTRMQPGKYHLVCSTFNPDTESNFQLQVFTDHVVQLERESTA